MYRRAAIIRCAYRAGVFANPCQRAKYMNGARRCFLVDVVLVGLSLCQSGCGLYMYDKGKSDAVKSAKTAFGDFTKKSPDRYDAMIKNLQRVAAEEDALV